jgi:ribosome-binding protein aMBF1 (putative translation factor)
MEKSVKIERLISDSSLSSWKEGVEWRRDNAGWLDKSSDIAFRILDALDELGWNKARLAEEMGVSPQQVSKYVKGEENFKLETLCKLEKVLGVELIRVMQADEEVILKSEISMVQEPSKPKYKKGKDQV